MADIAERLRSFGPDWTVRQTGSVVPYEVCVEAADEIERLRAALQELDDRYGQNQYFGIGRSIIRAALSSQK